MFRRGVVAEAGVGCEFGVDDGERSFGGEVQGSGHFQGYSGGEAVDACRSGEGEGEGVGAVVDVCGERLAGPAGDGDGGDAAVEGDVLAGLAAGEVVESAPAGFFCEVAVVEGVVVVDPAVVEMVG